MTPNLKPVKGEQVARVTVNLEESIKKAEATLRELATEQGWSVADAGTTTHAVHLVKGTPSEGWDSSITVHLESVSRGETRLSFAIDEAWAIHDWGRGRAQVESLLEAMGAEKD
jgi:hypothetical protein